MNVCRNCNKQNRQDARFCSTCGTGLSAGSRQATRPIEPSDLVAVRPRPVPAGQQVEEVKTRHMATPSRPRLARLPHGELLDNQRFAIISIVNQGSQENIYRIKDRHHRYCSQCGATNKHHATACINCHYSFASQPVEHPIYFLRETISTERLAQERALLDLNLHHPRLINLHSAFQAQPYGTHPRFYLVSDPKEGSSLVSLQSPLSEEQVLEWGQQLAEVIHYLHSRGVIHDDLRAENILIHKNDGIVLASSQQTKRVTSSDSTLFANEVKKVGQLLSRWVDPQQVSQVTSTLFHQLSTPNEYLSAQALTQAFNKALQKLLSATQMSHREGHLSNVGRKRSLNEDHLFTQSLEQTQSPHRRPIGLYVVADGMGGHSAGEVASHLATQALSETLWPKVIRPAIEESSPHSPNYRTLLAEACQNANRLVHAQGNKAHNDMGTTVVAALVVGNHAYIANVGDSRAYLINKRGINALTTDHSLVERLVAIKQITPEQAKVHPQRNVIYRTIGDKPQVEIDLVEQRLQNGDCLLLCSDGLHGLVDDATIHQVVNRAPTPQRACEELVRLANEAGGDDNITVIIVKLISQYVG